MSSIHLHLFCPNGTLRTLWLPQNYDGRYKFEPVEGEEELPFYVESVDGSWVMFSGDSAEFYATNEFTGQIMSIGNKLRLSDRTFGRLQFRGMLYATYAEQERKGDHALIPYRFTSLTTDYLIGRTADNTITYNRREVSRKHALLHWNGTCWEIRDLNSTNGVYVNGKRETYKMLQLGDVVFIMGLRIVVGSNYFAINNLNNRVTINTPYIYRIMPEEGKDALYTLPPQNPAVERIFDRPPRKLIKIEPEPIEIEMPPMKLNGNRLPLMLRLGSPLLMGGNALLSGNILSAMTSMVLPSISQGMSEKDYKEYEVRRQDRYGKYLAEKTVEIDQEKKKESDLLATAHPAVMKSLTFVRTKNRLWERRKVDEDFLSIRIGKGNLPLIAERRYSKKKFDLEEDALLDKMYALAGKPVVLENAPVLLSFSEDYVIGIQGYRQIVSSFIRNVILQLVTTHSYDELKICILAKDQFAKDLEFVRYLRHNWDDDRGIRFFASTQEDTQPIANYFKRKETEYFDNQGSRAKLPRKEPAFIIFALDKALFESFEFFKNILDEQEYHGISLVTSFDGIPKECCKIIQAKETMQLIDLKHPENPELCFQLDEYQERNASVLIQELFGIKQKTNQEMAALPSMITFLEMFQAGKVEFLNPLSRWKDNNPIKSLAARVGVGTDGSLFTLDLHEKRQGPHGLIAGMTGSGKSEFIITYILSMAVNYSPEEVAFILIDYKGGGLTDAFEDKTRGIHLPHLVGTITNLDGAAIQRSLMSINSELKRRQAEFKKAKSETNSGTMDIYEYQKLYRNKRVKDPMPHLFIISDEFAELKKQQPEFMDELISTARIGRSLGVHLILATQKPGGVVNDQIWSNTKFRVCLKVQDRGDSMEMLKRPEAAELKETGRFYLQVGYNEYFALGQSAWCGAGYYPKDEVVVEKDESVLFVDTAGQTILKSMPKTNVQKADCKQIVAIVKYLSDLAVREGIQARSLWLEPLPKKIELSDLLEEDGHDRSNSIIATIGIVDDPEKQSQYPLKLDMNSFKHMLLCGEGGSGKSTFLRTMLYSLASRYSPEELNYYILDLSSGALNAFRSMPHCGAYITSENESDFDRMLSLIKETVEERKKLFAEADVFGYEAYVKNHKLPLVLVLLDGWTNINTFRKGQEYGLNISTYMRDASNYGIRFILSINHLNEISAKAKQEIDYRIALKAKDKFDYNDILNVRSASVPPEVPGRGVCAIEGRPLEYHVAVLNCEEDEQKQNALLKKQLSDIAERNRNYTPAKSLPMMDDALLYEDFCKQFQRYRLPLGFTMDHMQPTAIPLQQLYTMGLFLGNPIGIKPVFSNLITCFLREDADVIIVRRKSDTVFNTKLSEQLTQLFRNRCRVLDTTGEDLNTLDSMIIENISAGKKQLRDEYCEMNSIPPTDRGRTKKASKYIRERSKPLFVLLESFSDLMNAEIDDALKAEFSALFSQIKGYNVYFIGCFYPEDENNSINPMLRSFMKEDLALLFGGCFHKEWITAIPSEFKKMEKVNPKYNRFVMKYHNDCYKMIMPCGELVSGTSDPDDEEIV